MNRYECLMMKHDACIGAAMRASDTRYGNGSFRGLWEEVADKIERKARGLSIAGITRDDKQG